MPSNYYAPNLTAMAAAPNQIVMQQVIAQEMINLGTPGTVNAWTTNASPQVAAYTQAALNILGQYSTIASAKNPQLTYGPDGVQGSTAPFAAYGAPNGVSGPITNQPPVAQCVAAITTGLANARTANNIT